MKVYILKRSSFEDWAMVIVAANTQEKALNVLRNNERAYLWFNPYDNNFKEIKDRNMWRFDSDRWEIDESPTLTANVDKPQIIDEI